MSKWKTPSSCVIKANFVSVSQIGFVLSCEEANDVRIVCSFRSITCCQYIKFRINTYRCVHQYTHLNKSRLEIVSRDEQLLGLVHREPVDRSRKIMVFDVRILSMEVAEGE